MRKAATVLFGATMFSLGYVLSHPDEDTLIIEKNANLLPDFVQPMNAKKVDDFNFKSDIAKDVCEELKKRYIMNDEGIYHNFLVSFAMGQRMNKVTDRRFLFMTETLNITKSSDGYEIDIFCADGFCKVKTQRIIDTTSLGVIDYNLSIGYEKSICCMVSKESEKYSLPDNAKVIDGLWNELILKYAVDKNADITSAKKTAFDTVNHITGCKLLSVSAYFAYDFKATENHRINDGHYFIPSASYSNILSALDGGASWNF